jgi:Helix-hairpin-helix motif
MSPRKMCLIVSVVLTLAMTAAPACLAQYPPPPELLLRLWPLYRTTRPVPLLPEEQRTGEGSEEGDQKKDRPLIAPFKPTKVDINNCTLAQLQNLPGVNASTAARIMAGRPYRNFADLERDEIPLNVVRGLRGAIEFGR